MWTKLNEIPRHNIVNRPEEISRGEISRPPRIRERLRPEVSVAIIVILRPRTVEMIIIKVKIFEDKEKIIRDVLTNPLVPLPGEETNLRSVVPLEEIARTVMVRDARKVMVRDGAAATVTQEIPLPIDFLLVAEDMRVLHLR